MQRMRHLKLIAAVTLVLVALSGFSPARSSGGRGGSKSHSKSRSGHGGGGCSSKKSSSHSSSRHYDNDYDNDYDSSGTTTSGSSRQNRARGSGTVTECAAAKGKKLKNRDEPGATVRVRNSGGSKGTFDVEVAFRDGDSEIVDTGSAFAVVRPGRSKTVQVPMDHPDQLRKVRECEVTSVS
ncbi:hypothetical protein AN217_04800 [Streptomyces qinglanensis]|uniref:Secreted protein n=1 Tax=Streptomyces qinglanensis TaxID=943816 RepID=A0A1E7K035_9ACTN|nr:hypothetical protein [Streptomyces qinglanensis]OEU97303.1 hypothetical protein AN217_04800 [Streptomyces qinglanensis]OEV23182.1 hypothetical protein AN220_25745 [Streptomyces nanshensis]